MLKTNILHETFFWSVVAAATLVPWVVGFTIHWWVGLAAFGLLFVLYDTLFVPRGAICMGIPFMFPLSSSMMYLGWGAALLIRWLRELTVGS